MKEERKATSILNGPGGVFRPGYCKFKLLVSRLSVCEFNGCGSEFLSLRLVVCVILSRKIACTLSCEALRHIVLR